MNDNKYEDLANAIIFQAYKDYKRALSTIMKTAAPHSTLTETEVKNRRQAFRSKRDIEIFFHSRWYEMLTDVDTSIVMNRAKAEVNWVEG